MKEDLTGVEFLIEMEKLGYTLHKGEDVNVAFINLFLDIAKNVQSLEDQVNQLTEQVNNEKIKR